MICLVTSRPPDGGAIRREAQSSEHSTASVMKTSSRFLLAAFVAAVSGLLHLSAAPPPSFNHPSLQPVKVDLPAYPVRMIHQGIHQGVVEILFEVETDGTVGDWLVTSYTHRDFARATERIVPTWQFAPSDAVHVVGLTLRFESRGVIAFVKRPEVNTTDEMKFVYRPCPPAELDRKPRPVNLVSPAYSTQLEAEGAVGVVRVTYYIDSDGRVRIPHTDGTAHPMLAALVVQAVKQWQFEPPTCRGRPTLVRAEQAFRFGEAAIAANGSGGSTS
jgi:TonB family protein